MNARIACGTLSVHAVRAAALAGLILTAGTISPPRAAAEVTEIVITDEPEPLAVAPEVEDGPAELLEKVVVQGEPIVPVPQEGGEGVSAWASYPGSPKAVCQACSGQGCRECRDAKGWFNRILCDVEPRFIGQVDAVFLWQGAIPSRSLYVEDRKPFDTVLDANQGQTPVSGGTRYGLQMNLDCTYAFEGNYFNVYGFEGEQSTPYLENGYAMNNLAGLDYGKIDWARFRTEGQIQSAEFNWRRKTCTPVTWLAGFRWVEWREGLNILDRYDGTSGVAFDQIDTRTGNDLYGGQVGADVMLWNRWQDVKVNGIGKAGIFYNQAYSRTNVPTELPPIDGDAQADQTALFAEVGANATVKLTHWLSWRLGYSVFWLSGVATAVDQLDRVGQAPPLEQPRINTNGSVLLHGATTGLEARW